MAIFVYNLPKGRIGWKAASYDTWCPYTAMTTADDSGEWAGLYVSPNRDTTEGYLPDFVDEDSGVGTSYIHEVHLLHPVNVLVCRDDFMADTSITGDEKAQRIRHEMPSNIRVGTGPLVPSLGRLGYFFACKHDTDTNSMELIVPNMLSALVVLMKRTTVTFSKFNETNRISH